ncbi:MAG: DUF4331 domain-containing protein [Pseudomonadota bacterium]
MKFRTLASALAMSTAVTAVLPALPAQAASHREAPMIAMDPSADITDVYAFVSYDEENLARAPEDRRVTFIMNVIPGQDPGDGPNYFNFSDEVLYEIHIDNDKDGVADDVTYQFSFETESRPVFGTRDTPLAYVGNPALAAAGLGGITALDGPGSEGMAQRQTYRVTEVRGKRSVELFSADNLVAVPSNVGPATMPDYEDLAAQGIYQESGRRVFAGQRAETFYIDLGAVFDTVNLRRPVPALSVEEDFNDFVDPFGVNRFSGFNVHTIAIEVPISEITVDGKSFEETAVPVIGMYASTSRRAIRNFTANGKTQANGPFRQIARMANPLFNELLIDTPFKDQWNASEPEDEAQFQPLFQDPTLATALNLIFGLGVPAAPRTDLTSLLLKYQGQPLNGTDCGDPCSELLRLDLRTTPTPAEQQSRLGLALSGGADLNGWPNGRRPNDDVTDIAIRVVGGSLYANARIGDGVNGLQDAPGAGTDDGPGYGEVPGNLLDTTANGIAKEFPFLPTPHDGRNRQHVDCDEEGANFCDEPIVSEGS